MRMRLPALTFALATGLVATDPAAAQVPGRDAASHPAQPPRTAAAPATGQQSQGMTRPTAAPMQVSAELDATLRVWERQSAQIQKLTGEHQRFVYDSISGIEKRGKGKFWFASPDRGRLDLVPVKVPDGALNEGMKTKDGKPYSVKSDIQAMWVCNGEEVLQVEAEQKGYYRTEIPPELRGKNIMQSPLPFLFGMKADEMKSRYRLKFGRSNTYRPGQDPAGSIVHITAYPTRKSDATNWSQADVYLDGATFLPRQIVLRDPYGSQITRYSFNLKTMAVNKNSWFQRSDPFHPNLSRYKLLGEQTAQRKVSQTPAR